MGKYFAKILSAASTYGKPIIMFNHSKKSNLTDMKKILISFLSFEANIAKDYSASLGYFAKLLQLDPGNKDAASNTQLLKKWMDDSKRDKQMQSSFFHNLGFGIVSKGIQCIPFFIFESTLNYSGLLSLSIRLNFLTSSALFPTFSIIDNNFSGPISKCAVHQINSPRLLTFIIEVSLGIFISNSLPISKHYQITAVF